MAEIIQFDGDGPFALPVIQRVESVALPDDENFLVRLHCVTADNKLLIVPLAPHCVEELVGLLKK